MCGISGYVGISEGMMVNETTIRTMSETMLHRGPDAGGLFLDLESSEQQFRIGLGHRRLSIIDLSCSGNQPMCNEDGSVWITYNGEVYNYQELRDRLHGKGHTMKSNTDTEAIVHMYEEEGVNCVDFLRGMFAFAIWDRNNRRMMLARDRLGVKPLYYYYDQHQLIFASEIKAIVASRKFTPEVDTEALKAYLIFGYVPAPYTMFKGVKKLPAGQVAVMEEGELKVQEYWDLSRTVKEEKSEKDWISEFDSMLRECVRMRLVSDVPLGVFLSGGLDSSAVVAYMAQATESPVKTFSVGYSEKEASELEYAGIVARTFNTDHHELRLEPLDFYDFIPEFVWHMDEPVVEAAAIPLYYLSKVAREHATVLLSGEGADELLAGYPIYKLMKIVSLYQKLPEYMRFGLFDPLLRSLMPSGAKWSKYANWLKMPLKDRYLGVAVNMTDAVMNSLLTPGFRDNGKDGHITPKSILETQYERVKDWNELDKMLYIDTKVWLPDDLLVKADKMSMAASVELRVPFLDYKLVEMAASMPPELKLRKGVSKYPLRKAMTGTVPSQIIWRKKRGFPVPIKAWFRGNFAEHARAMLLDRKCVERGYFYPEYVSRIITEHQAGQEDHGRLLFSLLALEMWHRVFIDGSIMPFRKAKQT